MTGVDSFAATAKMLVLTRRWSIHLDTDIISSTLTKNPNTNGQRASYTGLPQFIILTMG